MEPPAAAGCSLPRRATGMWHMHDGKTGMHGREEPPVAAAAAAASYRAC